MLNLEKIKNEIKQLAESNDIILYDLSWHNDKNGNILQVIIDNNIQGVDLDLCADFSEKVSKLLDNLDLIEDTYSLDVCSVGAERELKNIEDLKSAINQYVYVKMKNPKFGIFEVYGYLLIVDDDLLKICYKEKTRNKEIEISLDNISFIRLAVKI